jgi:hypothetical protein
VSGVAVVAEEGVQGRLAVTPAIGGHWGTTKTVGENQMANPD